MHKTNHFLILLLISLLIPFSLLAQTDTNPNRFNQLDVFELEYGSDPQISPDGRHVVYVRNFMDIMADRVRSNLWIINFDGSEHRPLTSGNNNYSSPRWSPDGERLLYSSNADGPSQLYMRWMDTGHAAKITNFTKSAGSVTWSPDGKSIAFTMFVDEKPAQFAKMPPKPEGAEWAKPAIYIDKLVYRADGAGYLDPGYRHIFVVPSEGGSPRQLTFGDFNHNGPLAWTPDSRLIIFSANRHSDWEYNNNNSEIYRVLLDDGEIDVLTDRNGPDSSPVLSPDGSKIAYLGFDDQLHGYHVTKLYFMNVDSRRSFVVTGDFDRDVQEPYWNSGSDGLYFRYDTEGNTKIAHVDLNGNVETLAGDVGGLSLGRPYSGGTYSVTPDGRFAFTHSRPDHPADIAVGQSGSDDIRIITALNEDLLGHKKLSETEEIWYHSTFDNRMIQGWVVKPADFDPEKEYPLILEIHGGPFANYGDRFSAEVQLYASAGYAVLYTNPRGSTSYGKQFGNLIHHNYPGEDYDDLMSGVNAALDLGYIDEDNLFVTGGSGGGVLSAWIVGKSDRFAAAVVAKPVINWYSFVLTSDSYPFFYKYWFPGFPWDHQDHYMKRSPLSLVGNVSTPTMLLTGEADHRTPISESEQFYQALKLRQVDAAMVRIPDASHGITARPSNLIKKVAHVLAWFEKYRQQNK